MCRELSWDTVTKLQADALLQEWTADRKPITSLGFKCELRRRLVLIDPATRRNLVQEDVGYWLREKEREGYWESVVYTASMRNGHYVYEATLGQFPEFIKWLKSEGWVGDDEDSSIGAVVFYRNEMCLSVRPSSTDIRTYRYTGEITIGPWVCKFGEYLESEDMKTELLAALSYLLNAGDEAPQEIDEVHEEVDLSDVEAKVGLALDAWLPDLSALDEFRLVPIEHAAEI